MKNLFFIAVFFFCFQNLSAQLLLDADGVGDTYELITSKLAPNYNPIEVPDCSHNAFGRHIDEVFDNELMQNVFRFYIHTTPDDDRCINFDRQRNEIKTYNQSPDSLLGVAGEIVEYKWKFKLDAGFQSSPKFTHLHQLKAVGGPESSMPLITLTTRKGTPDKLELRHAQTTSATTLQNTDLTPFKGVWCEVTETVLYGESGTYSVTIKNVSNNTTLFDYSNNNIRMWKTQADFIRPKWGIYRSLVYASDLRDEEVLFANFSIHENPPSALPTELVSFTGNLQDRVILLSWQTASEQNNKGFEIQKSTNSTDWTTIDFVEGKVNSNSWNYYSYLDQDPFIGQNYYRLKQIDFDDQFQYSDTVLVNFIIETNEINIAPNPVTNSIEIAGINENHPFEIFDSTGKMILEGNTINYKIDLSNLPNAVYLLRLQVDQETIVKKIIKK